MTNQNYNSLFWDQRYTQTEYIFGEEPNVFFKEQLEKLSPGNLLLPCEGEGRNAVYAAKTGWKVFAFDFSQIGREKANELAKNQGVSIQYDIWAADSAIYTNHSFDVIALIYSHQTPQNRIILHNKVIQWLKPGGWIILEGFNPAQLKNTSGGPKDISMLYTPEMLSRDFDGFNIQINSNFEIYLNEGAAHEGRADVIRFLAQKSLRQEL